MTGSTRQEELWRWLGISVGGTVLPFGVLALTVQLVTGHGPPLTDVFGRGELFIPASIMNVEAMWTWSHLTGKGRALWRPTVLTMCGTAALAGAVCFGVTAALKETPGAQITVSSAALTQLTNNVVKFSLGEFAEAFVLGTLGVVMLMLSRGQEEAAGSE